MWRLNRSRNYLRALIKFLTHLHSTLINTADRSHYWRLMHLNHVLLSTDCARLLGRCSLRHAMLERRQPHGDLVLILTLTGWPTSAFSIFLLQLAHWIRAMLVLVQASTLIYRLHIAGRWCVHRTQRASCHLFEISTLRVILLLVLFLFLASLAFQKGHRWRFIGVVDRANLIEQTWLIDLHLAWGATNRTTSLRTQITIYLHLLQAFTDLLDFRCRLLLARLTKSVVLVWTRDARAIVLPVMKHMRRREQGTTTGCIWGRRREFNLVCVTIYEGQGLFLNSLLDLSVDLAVLGRGRRLWAIVLLNHSKLLRHNCICLILLRGFCNYQC